MPGEGFAKIKDLALVTLTYTLTTDDGREIASVTEKKAVLDDGSLFPGLEIGLKSMKKGEQAKIIIAGSAANVLFLCCPSQLPS